MSPRKASAAAASRRWSASEMSPRPAIASTSTALAVKAFFDRRVAAEMTFSTRPDSRARAASSTASAGSILSIEF